MYESEITRFVRELHQKNPQLALDQKKGRALLWDRQLDAEEIARHAAARVEQQAYVYQTKV